MKDKIGTVRLKHGPNNILCAWHVRCLTTPRIRPRYHAYSVVLEVIMWMTDIHFEHTCETVVEPKGILHVAEFGSGLCEGWSGGPLRWGP